MEVTTDSAAAKGIAVRRGVGKVRHLETGSLWLHAAVAAKRFVLSKVDGRRNPSVLLTKFVDAGTLQWHLAALHLKVSYRRPGSAARSLVGGSIAAGTGPSGQARLEQTTDPARGLGRGLVDRHAPLLDGLRGR